LFAGKLVTYFMNLSVNYELFTRLVVYSKSYVADGDLVEENLLNLNDPVADLNMVSNSRNFFSVHINNFLVNTANNFPFMYSQERFSQASLII